MDTTKIIRYLVLLLLAGPLTAMAQAIDAETAATLEKVERLQLENQTGAALKTLEAAIRAHADKPDDLAYLYAHQSGIYVAMDSLLLGKRLLDSSMRYATDQAAKAVAYRAKAFLANYLNEPDEVVKDALTGLTYLNGNDGELITRYHLNYLLYRAYSKWGDREKMEKYILECAVYAQRIGRPNLLANVNNGLSSMYLADYRKSRDRASLDSMYHYLKQSFIIQQEHVGEVSGNTFAITCINLGNFYLTYSDAPAAERERQAYFYLGLAEEELEQHRASAEKWVNVYGIKSGFALSNGNILQAEKYLLQGLSRIQQSDQAHDKEAYAIFKHLSDIAVKKQDYPAALNYQQQAETRLRQILDHEQIFNAQKLEIQYETEKKNEQLKLLTETASLRKRQNYLYGGLALALLIGLVFMFSSYHFRLRYSIEREKKLANEKEEGERYAAMQLKMEKEEQARLRAEQELLELQRGRLQKEALANSLIIEHKNDMLNQIRSQLKTGDTHHVRKLLKEEALLNADFEEVKLQVQELHPGFFNQLTGKSVQKLTPLDLKYCTYIYLKMNAKQMAQALHVEVQSVRMFKYRLKQKLGLPRESDLEQFIQQLGN
ncbi:hypothetical protein [Parapedobacter lycopersici]|uniref:hypothetical protein n=1 Tax=Parapedobacter lycopersici TaxID=1864939 RepID=UPI00214D5B9D|nr:hypothetical protein [Parapedobacter lycopersici]